MKKLLALVMAVAMTLSLVACGGDKAPDLTTLKVGAIYINSKNDTAGYTYAHHKGITTAMTNLGMNPETQLVIVDEVLEDDTAVGNAIDTLVGAGCSIIFGISYGYQSAMNKKSLEYKDVVFAHATGSLYNWENFGNYFGRIYQARYLTGIAAGLKSLEIKNNNIGYVAAYGTEYAETCSGINAFALGVQAVNPDATVYVKTLGAWADEVNEKAYTEELINSYKCGIIAQHCDSAQPQIAAQNAGVFGCGYNSDMTVDAPNAHLTAAIWNWDVYYKAAIEAVVACNGDATKWVTKMNTHAYYAGVREGLVDVSPLSNNCAEGTDKAIAAVKAKLQSNLWDVFSSVRLKVSADGTIEETFEKLMDNTGKEVDMGVTDSNRMDDKIITATMNYYLAGVKEV